ncbi:hypothetical protein KUTeg_005264 [Tegillarca granosa]|uniref:Tc1-like transposase DDE domain-containing protein n=1 Tax=Tegillarca granosa TaxID=220873 RepID=A0ABQ9FJA2_TEGGR|nr:hypothetical protein KUTeg_005264 [Tegillarca granosa]
MREFREAGLHIVYLDETWVNAHHGRNYQCYGQDNNCYMIPPSGKGQRLIILHAGSSKHGFLNNYKLLFRSKTNSADYHDDMCGAVFMEWFKTQLIPSLTEKSVIVLDNASYHNLRVPGTESPTSSWKKCDIANWLTKINITYPKKCLKQELYTIANRLPIEYLTDKTAKENDSDTDSDSESESISDDYYW